MAFRLNIESRSWPLREPFVISRGVEHEFNTVQVTLADDQGHFGRGEVCPVYYAGETIAVLRRLSRVSRCKIEGGTTRRDLLEILPAGGAAMRAGRGFVGLGGQKLPRRSGLLYARELEHPRTGFYGIYDRYSPYRRLRARRQEQSRLQFPEGKSEYGRSASAAIEAVHRGAPHSALIVDPNQAWDLAALKAFAPPLAHLGVVLLEQPIAVRPSKRRSTGIAVRSVYVRMS